MRGDTGSAVEHFHRMRREARLHLPAHPAVGHGVVVAVDFDVVVDMHAHALPFGEHVRGFGQRLHHRTIERLEALAPTAGELAEGARIEPREQPGDRLVQLGEAEEALVP